MNNFSPNISIFRDIATVIDTDDMVNMYSIYHWRVLENQHIQVQIRDPERPTYFITCEFKGDGIISFDANNYMNINSFLYSASECRKEFKRILREIYDIKL